MTGTTFTTDTLYCNAELQTMIVETGLDFFNNELQWILLIHNNIKMKGWLKSYNQETGELKILIEYYNGGGGDSYSGWDIINIIKPSQYLNELKNKNIILDGDIISINEELETSIAKASFLVGDEVKQKYIVLYEDNNHIMSWKFYIPTDNITIYDYSNDDWKYPAFSKRIVAPIQLAMQYPAIEVWFRLNNLPVFVEDNTVYLYCNVILPEHQALVDSLQGVVYIQNID